MPRSAMLGQYGGRQAASADWVQHILLMGHQQVVYKVLQLHKMAEGILPFQTGRPVVQFVIVCVVGCTSATASHIETAK